MKVVAVVRRALAFAAELREGREGRARGALARDAVFVRAVQMTTLVARGLGARAAERAEPVGAAERATLEVLAAQLRHMGGALAGDAPALGRLPDPRTPEGALLGLVGETLALVERLLATAPPLGGQGARALPPRRED